MALFFCSVLAVVMSASRSALFALVTSIFYIIFFVSNASKSKKRIVGLLFVGVLFVAPFAERAFKGLVNKQMSRLEQNDGKLNSRDEKFQARLNEFYDSPLWGVGFASINGKRYDTTHLHIREWLECIRQGKTPSCNIDAAFQEAMTAHMGTRAYLEGRTMYWDKDKEEIVRGELA